MAKSPRKLFAISFTGYKFFFFFLIGNKNFIEKTEHRVHDGECFEQEQDTGSY